MLNASQWCKRAKAAHALEGQRYPREQQQRQHLPHACSGLLYWTKRGTAEASFPTENSPTEPSLEGILLPVVTEAAFLPVTEF